MAFKLLDKTEQAKVLDILEKAYPDAKYYLNFKTPIDLLVAAILSAQTRDQVTNAATPELFKAYKTAKQYADSTPDDLIRYIGKVSFAGAKAKNIIKACQIIVQKYKGEVPNKMEGLLELPGVGRKTANTILINAYGIVEGIPTDTWVIKLSHRIGFSKSSDPEDIEKDLMQSIEKKHWKKLAYVFKAHGHKICQSQIPICSQCVLSKMCPRNDVTKSK
jgi:endonuclease III